MFYFYRLISWLIVWEVRNFLNCVLESSFQRPAFGLRPCIARLEWRFRDGAGTSSTILLLTDILTNCFKIEKFLKVENCFPRRLLVGLRPSSAFWTGRFFKNLQWRSIFMFHETYLHLWFEIQKIWQFFWSRRCGEYWTEVSALF